MKIQLNRKILRDFKVCKKEFYIDVSTLKRSPRKKEWEVTYQGGYVITMPTQILANEFVRETVLAMMKNDGEI